VTIILVSCLAASAVLAAVALACCWRRHAGGGQHRPKRDPRDLPLLDSPPRTVRERWLRGQDELRGDRPGVEHDEKENEQ
jgi:hypothetical protein